MLELPDPLTSTFIAGIACGICSTFIASWVWRRSRATRARRFAASLVAETLPPELDMDIRARSWAFADATGRPQAAPFVYSAIRDRALVGHGTRERSSMRTRSSDERR